MAATSEICSQNLDLLADSRSAKGLSPGSTARQLIPTCPRQGLTVLTVPTGVKSVSPTVPTVPDTTF